MPLPPRRLGVLAARRRRRGEHVHVPPGNPAQAAVQTEARQHEAAPAGSAREPRRQRDGVVQHVPGQLGVRRRAADVRRGGLPLRGAGVRLPEVRPPRQALPQVPVAPRLLRAPEVQRARLAEQMEGEEDTVRGGLHQPEPMGVAGVHAARGRAGLQDQLQQGQPRLLRHVPGLRTVGGVLPEHLSSGHRRRADRPGVEARLHLRRRVARHGHARLQHLALVDPHRQGPTMGLCARWGPGHERHGPAHGLLQGDVHMGQMGRLKRGHLQDQGLFPGHLSDPLQWSTVGGELQQLCTPDAADRGADVSGRAASGAGRGEECAERHVQAGVPAGHHAAVAAEEGRAPVGVQRRPPGQRLQPLVPCRPARHLEPDPLRVAPCIGDQTRVGRAWPQFLSCCSSFIVTLILLFTGECLNW